MTPAEVLKQLRAHGVRLTVEGERLKVKAAAPPPVHLLDAARESKADLLRLLTEHDKIPRLPWQLERLVSAASNDLLTFRLPGVFDTNHYILAWAAAYLTSDRDEALRRLWSAYRTWHGVS